MTIQRIYSCDLCHTGIDPAKENAVGVYWTGDKMTFKPIREVEHHVCDKCSESIIELWQKRARPVK